MHACADTFHKTIAALAAMATLALANISVAATLAPLPSRLEQHVLMLAAAARGASAADAPDQAARYIETALAAQGHTVSRRNYAQQGHPVRNIDITLSNPATAQAPARVLIVGASYASATRRNDGETAVVIELARMLKNLRPAAGTEVKLVFLVSGVSQETGNFIAFAGTRGAAELVRKTLGSFRATLPAEGLAAPAYVEGVTLLGHAARRAPADPALMITGVAFLHYPYSHTLQRQYEAPDYASMARSVNSLAKLVASLAAPPTM